MSILIKGMEMPTRCADCKMYVEDIYCCHLLHREIENPWADDGVELDCPLVEIPPHGDLIDRDALMDDIIGSIVFSGRKVPTEAAIVQKVLDIVGDANAIIPSEEGE